MRNNQAASLYVKPLTSVITDPDEMHQDKRLMLLQRLGYRGTIKKKN